MNNHKFSLTWEDIINIEEKSINNKKDLIPYHIIRQINSMVSSPNEESEPIGYWFNKQKFFENIIDFLNIETKPIKISTLSDEKITELYNKIKSRNLSVIEIPQDKHFFIKSYGKITKTFNKHSYIGSIFNNLSFDNIVPQISHKNLKEGLFNLKSEWKITPQNFYSFMEKLNEKELLTLYAHSKFYYYLENNLSELFNIYVEKTKVGENILLHKNIMAECFYSLFSYSTHSYISNHFSFLTSIDNQTAHISSLGRIPKGLASFHKDTSSNYALSKYSKHIKCLKNYVDALSYSEKENFFSDFPTLLNTLSCSDISIIEKIAQNYFKNYESKYAKLELKFSMFNDDKKKKETPEEKSRKFFLNNFSSRITQDDLNSFDNQGIIYLLENGAIRTDLKIPKNKTIKTFVINNLVSQISNLTPHLSSFIKDRIDLNKSFEFFKKISTASDSQKILFFTHLKNYNDYFLTINLNIKSEDKYLTEIKNNIISYICDEKQDLSILLEHFKIDPLLSLGFLSKFSTLNFDDLFKVKEAHGSINDYPYILSYYTETENIIFQRFRSVFNELLSTNILFLHKNAFRSYIYDKDEIININNSFHTNIETIYSKFHLLAEFSEKISKFKDQSYTGSDSYLNTTYLSNPLKDINSSSNVSFFLKTNKFIEKLAPSNILYLIANNNDNYLEIIKDYSQLTRNLYLKNKINYNNDLITPYKKKI